MTEIGTGKGIGRVRVVILTDVETTRTISNYVFDGNPITQTNWEAAPLIRIVRLIDSQPRLWEQNHKHIYILRIC